MLYDTPDLIERLSPGLARASQDSDGWQEVRDLGQRYPDPKTQDQRPQQPCRQPQAWNMDPSVCVNDGRLISDHDRRAVPAELAPYEQALMNWVVRNGGIAFLYGGYGEVPTLLVRKHVLEDCTLALPDCVLPSPTVITEFGDTLNDAKVEGLEAELTCECGKVSEVDWVIKQSLTLGEVMFQVIKEGGRPSTYGGVRSE